MTLVRELSAFPSLTRSLIGFDRLHDDLLNIRFPESTYPPANLKQTDSDHYVLELACAGIDPKDISVTTKNGVLTISCDTTEKDSGATYLFKGIASRSFVRELKLYEHINVTDATFENGILRIDIERKLPDHLKPQKIEIKTSKAISTK